MNTSSITSSFRTLLLGSILPCFAACATAQEHPDFSGVWEAYASVRGNSSPITAGGRQLIEDFEAQFGENFVEPGSYCVPPGLVGIMTAMVSYPIEVIHSENRVTILTEYDMQVRRIFMDGRELPGNYPTTRMGYSTGHWNSERLEVDTGLLSEWLVDRWPRSEQTQVHESVYKITLDEAEAAGAGFTGFVQPAEYSDEVLVFELTVEDPTFWTEPQEITMYYQRIPDDSFLEYDCPADLWRRALSGELEWNL